MVLIKGGLTMSYKECLNCGEQYYVPKCRDLKTKYCSQQCMYNHKKAIGRTLKDCKCSYCGKSFQVEKRLKGKYCSEECFHLASRNRVEVKCLNCGKAFEMKRSQSLKCCSLNCRREYAKENKIDRSFYGSREWKLIRYKTIARDDFKCSQCGEENYTLHVHHVVPVREGGSDELDNLITLCPKCHRAIHIKKVV